MAFKSHSVWAYRTGASKLLSWNPVHSSHYCIKNTLSLSYIQIISELQTQTLIFCKTSNKWKCPQKYYRVLRKLQIFLTRNQLVCYTENCKLRCIRYVLAWLHSRPVSGMFTYFKIKKIFQICLCLFVHLFLNNPVPLTSVSREYTCQVSND